MPVDGLHLRPLLVMDWGPLLRNNLPTLTNVLVSNQFEVYICIYVRIQLNKQSMPFQRPQNLALKAMITCPGGSIRTLRGDPNVKKASLVVLL